MTYDPEKNIKKVFAGIKKGEPTAKKALFIYLWEELKEPISKEVYRGQENGYALEWFHRFVKKPFFPMITTEEMKLPRIATNKGRLEWLKKECMRRFRAFGFRDHNPQYLPDGFAYKLIGGIKNKNKQADDFFLVHMTEQNRAFLKNWLWNHLKPYTDDLLHDTALACLKQIQACKFPSKNRYR